LGSLSQGQNRFIILKKIKYSEADLIIHAISPQGEKMSFIARGALRSKKRFGGGILEPTHFVQFTYKEASEQGQMNVLNEATMINDFAGIRKSYDQLELALHFVECVGKVSQEGDRNSDFLFNLLGHSLRALETTEDAQVLKMHFYLKFLLQQGVINPEPWMTPFLRTNIADSNQLMGEKKTARDHMFHTETMVRQYLQTATI
jgi:DNA repair protein RecO (recombination protein O)